MRGAGAILRLSKSPLSRSAGEGLGVRAIRSAGEGLGVRAIRSAGEGLGVRAIRSAGEGLGVRAAPHLPPSAPTRRERRGDARSMGDPAAVQITPLPQRGRGAGGEGYPYIISLRR